MQFQKFFEITINFPRIKSIIFNIRFEMFWIDNEIFHIKIQKNNPNPTKRAIQTANESFATWKILNRIMNSNSLTQTNSNSVKNKHKIIKINILT